MGTERVRQEVPAAWVEQTDCGVRLEVWDASGPLLAVVSVKDLRRLEELDANAIDRQRARRRGLPWENWEDDLCLDGQLDDVDIAVRTERTLKSVIEHRRWILRIADAARNGK